MRTLHAAVFAVAFMAAGMEFTLGARALFEDDKCGGLYISLGFCMCIIGLFNYKCLLDYIKEEK